jgi:large subunit ribosomal protein L27
MAHKKAGGSTRLGRDSQAKRLGIKKYSGEKVKPGEIIVRQRGSRYKSGNGTGIGKDYTIFAKTEGIVRFQNKKIKTFTSNLKKRQIVSITNK